MSLDDSVTGGLLVATVGLPASGKTTYVETTLREGNLKQPGLFVRAGRDHLRTALHVDHGYEAWMEDDVTAIQNAIIRRALTNNRIVLVDDMNLKASYRQKLANLAATHGANYYQVDFTHVPLDDLKQRDASRERSVGAEYIDKMYQRFVKPLKGSPMPWPKLFSESTVFETVEWIPGLPEAILVDIDGTVATMNGRSPYDYTRVSEDLPKQDVISQIHHEVYNSINPPVVIFLSGRKASCYSDTVQWLYENVKVPFRGPFMRSADDNRADYVVKSELFDEHVRGKYNVRYILDDRNQVVNMWRKRNLLCLQVAEGDF